MKSLNCTTSAECILFFSVINRKTLGEANCSNTTALKWIAPEFNGCWNPSYVDILVL